MRHARSPALLASVAFVVASCASAPLDSPPGGPTNAARADALATRAKDELARWDRENPECGPPDATLCTLPACTISTRRLHDLAKTALPELAPSSFECIGMTPAGALVHATEDVAEGDCHDRDGLRRHWLVLVDGSARVLGRYDEPLSGCPCPTTAFAFRLWQRRGEIVREAEAAGGDVVYARLTPAGFVPDARLTSVLRADDRRHDALERLAHLHRDAELGDPAVVRARRELGW